MHHNHILRTHVAATTKNAHKPAPRKVFVRDGEPTVFNVLVNASGILEFALVSKQPDCEYTISFDPQQDAQIRIHPVTPVPADMHFVEGNNLRNMQAFQHEVRGSGSRFDFVVDRQSVGITFTELAAMTVPEAEESEEHWDDDEHQQRSPQEKTIEISRWMTCDYGLGTQRRVTVNVSSPQRACSATLVFTSSTAFVFPEEYKPLHLRQSRSA